MSQEINEPTRETGESSQYKQRRRRYSIIHAPAHIRDGRESDFEPKLVSIGPYFYGRENLKCMEKVKLRCALDLIKRVKGNKNALRRFLLGELEVQDNLLRECYEETNDLPHDDFIWMLGIDSCFIIRIALSFSQAVQESMDLLDDVNIKHVRSDMLLLENQIPLFFITKVYQKLCATVARGYPPFRVVFAHFLSSDMPWGFNIPNAIAEAHLLDLYWHYSSPTQTKQENSAQKPEQEQPSWAEVDHSIDAAKIIPNATALHQMAGITFEELNNAFSKRNLLDANCLVITFSKKKRHLEDAMPENALRNYMKLMDALIDTKKDVELLQQCGVIRNTLSSHLTAATFFNDIGDLCVVDNSNYIFSGLYKDVLEYYNSKWNRRWASLQNNYFSSPWAGISVLAGGTLLILTVLQTFYTVYGYYRPR